MPKINYYLSPRELRLERSHLREIRLVYQAVERLVFDYSRYDRVIEKKPLETYEPPYTSEDEIKPISGGHNLDDVIYLNPSPVDYWRARFRYCKTVKQFQKAVEELIPILEISELQQVLDRPPEGSSTRKDRQAASDSIRKQTDRSASPPESRPF
mgnify:CR=1 FL=1